MFGSTVLEVALGLTLLYLALSLVCSAMNEYYSAMLSRRSNHLKSALFGLVNQDDPRGRRFLAMFFSHPLIKALSPSAMAKKPGKTAAATAAAGPPSAWLSGDVEAVLKSLKGTPQYIPDRTFADVIVDLLAGRASATAAPDDVAVPPTPAGAVDAIVKDLQEAVGKVSGDLVQKGLRTEVDERATALRAAVAAATTPRLAWDAVASALAAIRAKVAPVADAKGRDGLFAVIDRWDARLRATANDRAASATTLKEAGEAIAALQGLIVGLPESVAKARLRMAADDEQTKLRALDPAATDSAASRAAVTASLGAVQAAAGALPQDDTRAAILARVDEDTRRLASSSMGVVTLQKIRDAIDDLPPSAFKTALHSLTDESGTSLDEVKDNLAGWYNDTMDRLGGWYKRNTQVIVFIMALIVAFGLNADTVAIATRLIQDPVLRDSAAASARALVDKDRPQSRPAPTATGPASGAPDGTPATKAAPTEPAPSAPPADPSKAAVKAEPSKPAPDPSKAAPDPSKAAVKADPSKAAAPSEPSSAPPDAAKATPSDASKVASVGPASTPPEFTEAQQADIAQTLDRLKLPLGWDETKVDKLAALAGQSKKATFREGLEMLVGLLITTLALTMGAPFWYDVLDKVVNVRSAGEKPEKTT